MGATARQPRVPLSAAPDPTPIAPPAPDLTPSLDAAVLRVMAQAAPLMRNAVGQIQNRQYTYVTLASVVNDILPLLVAEDLLWKTFPTTLEGGDPGLRYKMTHVPSGEFDEDTMPLPCDATMQGLGSGITYGRRYALVSYLQLTVDEDDDGASANTRPAAAPAPPPQPAATAAAAAQPKRSSGGRPASAKQKNMIRARVTEAAIPKLEFAQILSRVADGQERTWSSETAADRWTSMTLDRLPGKLVDDVLTAIAECPPF